jgi:hypothetical protein
MLMLPKSQSRTGSLVQKPPIKEFASSAEESGMATGAGEDEGIGEGAASIEKWALSDHARDYLGRVEDELLRRAESPGRATIAQPRHMSATGSVRTATGAVMIESSRSKDSPWTKEAMGAARIGDGRQSAAFREKQGLSVDVRDGEQRSGGAEHRGAL